MKITVTNPAGAQLFFELEESLRLEEVARCVNDEAGVPCDMQSFFSQEGTELSFQQPLSELASGEQKLDLVLRYDLDGGGARCETQSPACNMTCCCLECRCISNCSKVSCCCCRGVCTVM